MRDTRYKDANWLRGKYIDEELSSCQIAMLYGQSSRTILRWLRRHGIPVRSWTEAGKAAWARGDFGSEEWRRKNSEASKAAWARGAYDGEDFRRQMSETSKAAHARGRYASESCRRKKSDALDTLGVGHEPQFRPPGYSRVYDELVFPDVLIEVQGDYFHSLDGVAERDTEKADWAIENGFNIVALWEHEIHKDGALRLVKERVLPLIQS